MPYVETVKHETAPTGRFYTLASPAHTPAERLTMQSVDKSFRTRIPSDGITRVIPTSTMEPYTWFLSLQKLKREALKATDFDISTLTVDSGHTWSNEKWVNPALGLDCSVKSSSWTMEFYNALPRWTNGDPRIFNSPPASGLESWAAVEYGDAASMSNFSLAQFLGELKDLPRIIPDLIRRGSIARSAGSDYLNVEFGWKPLVSDLQAITLSLLEASMGMFRPFGAYHRRRVNLPIETFDRYDGSGTFTMLYGNQILANQWESKVGSGGSNNGLLQGIYSSTLKTKVKRSLEGEFVYLPKAGFDPTDYWSRAETLMDVNLTPATLWELSPFSWLVDWFSDIGGAVQSMEAAVNNRILSTYCYAMESTEMVLDQSVAAIRPAQSSNRYFGKNFWQGESSYTRKRRIRANPFGFEGSSSTRPTGGKAAILIALGLTKS